MLYLRFNHDPNRIRMEYSQATKQQQLCSLLPKKAQPITTEHSRKFYTDTCRWQCSIQTRVYRWQDYYMLKVLIIESSRFQRYNNKEYRYLFSALCDTELLRAHFLISVHTSSSSNVNTRLKVLYCNDADIVHVQPLYSSFHKILVWSSIHTKIYLSTYVKKDIA